MGVLGDVGIDGEPEVDRWYARPDLFVVTYKLSGRPGPMPEFEQEVNQIGAELGIETTSYTPPDTIQFYGLRKGQEARLHNRVVAAVDAESARRARQREEEEQARPEREAEEARRQAELEAVRQAFREAERGGT